MLKTIKFRICRDTKQKDLKDHEFSIVANQGPDNHKDKLKAYLYDHQVEIGKAKCDLLIKLLTIMAAELLHTISVTDMYGDVYTAQMEKENG
jgi:hypothetical protein